ncbi:separase [Dorcoceras hygrometricum]|uniref:Separase n=1 Tax=Dorcoceras hygrometricum TaxID=472368 RepID=A0A2Z7ALA9_9LAMI|nr:separase [Dorcoceras hygrometricum]
MTSVESVDGLSMMTSAVSSQSADEESSAGALSEDGDNQQRASTSRGNLKLAIAKRRRLDKWTRQRFAFALSFSRWFCEE